MRRAILAGLLLAAAALTGCAGAPTYHYAFDPDYRFTMPKTYAWYEDPSFEAPRGTSVVDGRFIDENIRRAVDETLKGKGVVPVAAGATPDIYVSYITRPEAVADQDRFGHYSWWGMSAWYGTKYRKQGTLFLDVRDPQHKLVWRGLKTAILGTNPDALRKDIDRAVSELLAQYPPPPGAKNVAAPAS